MLQPQDPTPDELTSLEIDGTDTPDSIDHPQVRQRKEMSKKRVALIIILITIILVVGGIAAYFFLLKSNPAPAEQTTPATTTTQDAPKKLTAQLLVDKAKQATQGKVAEKITAQGGEQFDNFSAPPYRPNGYNFSVRPDTQSGYTATGTKDIIAQDLAAIETVLTNNQLSKTVLDPGSDEGMYASQFESSDIICSVSDQKPYNQPATSENYSVTLGCANKSDYLANAAMLRPYFIIYSAQSQYDTTHTLMGTLTIKASKSEGYSIATVSIGGSDYGSVGGFAGLFYITPDKSIHYFTGTQSEIPCSKFSTVDLKKAYLGEQCYDETNDNTNATVTL